MSALYKWALMTNSESTFVWPYVNEAFITPISHASTTLKHTMHGQVSL